MNCSTLREQTAGSPPSTSQVSLLERRRGWRSPPSLATHTHIHTCIHTYIHTQSYTPLSKNANPHFCATSPPDVPSHLTFQQGFYAPYCSGNWLNRCMCLLRASHLGCTRTGSSSKEVASPKSLSVAWLPCAAPTARCHVTSGHPDACTRELPRATNLVCCWGHAPLGKPRTAIAKQTTQQEQRSSKGTCQTVSQG